MSMVNDDVKSVKVDPEQHTLMVTLNDAIISKRLLAMKPIGDNVYFFGYEGYASSLIDLDASFFYHE